MTWSDEPKHANFDEFAALAKNVPRKITGGSGLMGARVETEYEREFVLTEENIIRIADIITTRTASLDDATLGFRVYRKDDFYVDYESTNQVVSEDNSARNLITKIIISLTKKDKMDLKLILSKEGKSKLLIESEDRDLAFLLASELKEYINGEVFLSKFRIGTILTNENLNTYLQFIPLIFMVFLMYQIAGSSSIEVPQAILQSNDIAAKLNYLLTWRERSPSGMQYTMYIVVTLMLLSILLLLVRRSRDKLATRIFYWGRQTVKYDRYKGIKEKILWVVVIGLMVGIAGGMMTGRIQSLIG